MKEIKRDTNTDLMNNVFELVKKNGSYDKAEKIMDYFLAESHYIRKLSNYQFDFCAVPSFGGSEGIYIDCYINGIFDENDKESHKLSCGTFKTLETSLSAMQMMGELCGSLTYFARQYVNENLERFIPESEMRCSQCQN